LTRYGPDEIQVIFCLHGNDDGDGIVPWNGCDRCDCWYHQKCIPEAQAECKLLYDGKNKTLICGICTAEEVEKDTIF